MTDLMLKCRVSFHFYCKHRCKHNCLCICQCDCILSHVMLLSCHVYTFLSSFFCSSILYFYSGLIIMHHINENVGHVTVTPG